MFSNRILSTYFTYKFELNMFISIMHRVTGIFLYFIITFFFIYLYSQSVFNNGFISLLYNTILFNLLMISNNFNFILVLFIVFIFYHLMTGIRHYIWEEKLMLGKTINNQLNIYIIATFLFNFILALVLFY